MGKVIPKPCLTCGTPTRNQPSYCPTCTPNSPRAQRGTHHWKQTSQQAIRQWVATHGWHCPGYQVPPHPATDLTTDHTQPLARGGNHQQLAILCRSCNSRKGARQ